VRKWGFFAPQSQIATSHKGKKTHKINLHPKTLNFFLISSSSFYFFFSPISSFLPTSPILLLPSSLSFNREREMVWEKERRPTVQSKTMASHRDPQLGLTGVFLWFFLPVWFFLWFLG
jgi:hypothetical protein